MDSIFAKIFLNVQARIKEQCPQIKWIDQDYGQLENYGDRPPTLWPCVLLDFEQTGFENMGQLAQNADGILLVRLAMNPFGTTHHLTPEQWKEMALNYMNLEHNLHLALQGHATEFFGPMIRISAVTEERNDSIRVRQIRYTLLFEDTGIIPTPLPEELIPRPDPTIILNDLEIETDLPAFLGLTCEELATLPCFNAITGWVAAPLSTDEGNVAQLRGGKIYVPAVAGPQGPQGVPPEPIIQYYGEASYTGGTTEQILQIFEIEPGKWDNQGIYLLKLLGRHTAPSTATNRINIYINSVNGLSGATLMRDVRIATNNTYNAQGGHAWGVELHLWKNAGNLRFDAGVQSGTAQLFAYNDVGYNTADNAKIVANLTPNFSNSIFLIVTCINAAAGVNTFLSGLLLKKE